MPILIEAANTNTTYFTLNAELAPVRRIPVLKKINSDMNESKYARLETHLREQIARGHLKPGDRLPSLTEMRGDYDVSRTTVERVHVRLEQDGLIRREQGRGTFVSEPPPPPQTGFIGFCASGLHTRPLTHYWHHLLEGVQEITHREQFNIVLLHPEKSQGWDKVDAVLVAEPHEERWRPRVPAGLPHVALLYPARDCASVLADDYRGGELAVEHLLELGHRRIACLESSDNTLFKRRLAGYRDALQSSGIAPNPDWLWPLTMKDGESFEKSGETTMKAWLVSGWRETGCSAILTQNDHFAQGVMRALQDAGLRVPEDVSVIGFDGTETGENMTPPLTSIAVPLAQIGTTGMEILLRQMKGEAAPSVATVLPTLLKRRNSTALKK